MQPGSTLTHLDTSGAANMVDVTDKPATDRTARAEGRIVMQPETLALIREGDAKKGDVIGTARLAGIMAAKRTHELIPLCHPLLLRRYGSSASPTTRCRACASPPRCGSRARRGSRWRR